MLRLTAPPRPTRGPDGQGWNRLSIAAYGPPSDECALRPLGLPELWITAHRPHTTRYGGYGPCIKPNALGDSACATCPVATRTHQRLNPAWGPRVGFRIVWEYAGFQGAQRLRVLTPDGEREWPWWDLVHDVRSGRWELGSSHPSRDGEFEVITTGFVAGAEVTYRGSIANLRGCSLDVEGPCDCDRCPEGERRYRITDGALLRVSHVRESSLRGAYTRLPEEEKREVAADFHRAGRTPEAIAATLGVSRTQVIAYTRGLPQQEGTQ